MTLWRSARERRTQNIIWQSNQICFAENWIQVISYQIELFYGTEADLCSLTPWNLMTSEGWFEPNKCTIYYSSHPRLYLGEAQCRKCDSRPPDVNWMLGPLTWQKGPWMSSDRVDLINILLHCNTINAALYCRCWLVTEHMLSHILSLVGVPISAISHKHKQTHTHTYSGSQAHMLVRRCHGWQHLHSSSGLISVTGTSLQSIGYCGVTRKYEVQSSFWTATHTCAALITFSVRGRVKLYKSDVENTQQEQSPQARRVWQEHSR